MTAIRRLCLLLATLSLLLTVAPAQAQRSVEAAIERARTAMLADPQRALDLARDAERLALSLPAGRDRTIAQASVLWLRSEAHLRLNDVPRARPLIDRALKLVAPFPGPIRIRGDLLLTRGTYQMDDGRAAQALGSYQEAHEIFRLLGEKRRQSVALSYIGALYSAANDNSKAERYYRNAAEAFDGDPSLSLTLHNNRGNVLLVLERYREAEAEYLEALRLAREMENPLLEARVLGNLARNQVEARDYAGAERTLARGFSLTRGSDAQALRQQLLATAARIAMEQGDPQRARSLIDETFAGVDLKSTTSAFTYAHTVAYLVYEATGDAALALSHLEAVRRLKDEAAKVATTTAAALAAAQFDFANQEVQIANMKAEQAARAARYQRNIFIGVGVAVTILIALLSAALFVIRRSRNQVRAANVVLGDTNTALEKALKAKTEFLATTSHEIRTPLNGILGMTQVMLRDATLDAATRDRIGIVHGAGVTMRSLVDDILDVAKIETGNLTVDAAPMDLCATLKEVTRMWEEQARAKGLGFDLHLARAPQWIVSDAGRLRQVVFNLLSNAIKFTDKGAVGLRAFAEGEGEGARLKLVVTDSGIGIPHDKRDEIFESFRQADSGTTRRFGGTGLGLTICRNLARALGGDITVDSVEGRGSRFTVDLPLVPAQAPVATAAAGEDRGTLLVLDRNPIARSMLKTLFEPRVGTLCFVATPAQALERLAELGVAQLLVDEATLKAAGEDPHAMLRELAGAAETAGAASAVLWLKPEDEVRRALLATGIGQVIARPVAGTALVEALLGPDPQKSDNRDKPRLVSRAA